MATFLGGGEYFEEGAHFTVSAENPRVTPVITRTDCARLEREIVGGLLATHQAAVMDFAAWLASWCAVVNAAGASASTTRALLIPSTVARGARSVSNTRDGKNTRRLGSVPFGSFENENSSSVRFDSIQNEVFCVECRDVENIDCRSTASTIHWPHRRDAGLAVIVAN